MRNGIIKTALAAAEPDLSESPTAHRQPVPLANRCRHW